MELREALSAMGRSRGRKSMAYIYSVNYDFQPMIHDYPKSVWVDLKFPPPSSLKVGFPARIVSTDPSFTPPDQTFLVQDIVGTRVILSSHADEGEVYWRSIIPYHANRGREVDGRWHGWKASQDPSIDSDQGASSFPTSIASRYGDYDFARASRWGYVTRGSEGSDKGWLYGRGRPVGMLIW